MKKKVLLGVLSALVIGFSVNSFLSPKDVNAQANVLPTSNVQTATNNIQTLKFSETTTSNNNLNQNNVNFNEVTSNDASGSSQATIENGTQSITTELAPYGYPDLIIQKGVPFKWVMNVSAENLNGCNNEIVIDALGISKSLQVGENIVEFTPTESGVIAYSCWMGMQTGTIAVVDELNNVDANEIQTQIQALPPTGGCCGN